MEPRHGPNPTPADSFTPDVTRAIPERLREIADDLRSLGRAFPAALRPAAMAQALEGAALEVERLRGIQREWLRMDRPAESEARLCVEYCRELPNDQMATAAVLRVLERAEQRGAERVIQAPEGEHRGMDWQAIRMAGRP